MPAVFIPVLGFVASMAVSALMRPKVPKAPTPAPAPPPPAPAAVPTPPPEPKQEPTISPEDSAASAKTSQTKRRRNAVDATKLPLTTDDSTVGFKTLLGE